MTDPNNAASTELAEAELLPNGLVSYFTGGGVALLTLTNLPANGYSYEMMRDLDEGILRARFDDDVHVIVLAGAGEKFFCAGADIGTLGSITPRYKYSFCLHANETLMRLENTHKLTIAALGGHCVGGGLEVALGCDLRVAHRGSGKCGLPEVALGVLPGTGGTQRLARILGKSRAIRMMVTGKLTDYDDALSQGLVDEVFDAESGDDFLTAALDYARTFCPPGKAAKSVGLIKRAVQSGTEMSLENGLALERELQQQLFQSSDAAEGIAAFLEKREPRFTGE